jgi:hypothetical protein
MAKPEGACDEQFARTALDDMDDRALSLLDILQDAVLDCGWNLSKASLKPYRSPAFHNEPAVETLQ